MHLAKYSPLTAQEMTQYRRATGAEAVRQREERAGPVFILAVHAKKDGRWRDAGGVGGVRQRLAQEQA